MTHRRRTIGVIINTMDESYQMKIWTGINKSAVYHDVNLLFFCGMALSSGKMDEEQKNVIYQLVNGDRLDGLILVAGTIEADAGVQSVEEFIRSFDKLPIVSISIVLNGAYNVLLDNEEAMKEIFSHLVDVHGYKDIAYISGPLCNGEAVIRLNEYRNHLKKYSQYLIDEKIYFGDFLQKTGGEAVDHFLSQGGKLPEAIVAANDEMAIGAYLRLQELGYRVPEDVALTGFDDIDSVRAFFPPFTTVFQPLYMMGIKSIELICNLIEKREVPVTSLIKGKLIVRESCGCFQTINEADSISTIELTTNIVDYDGAIRQLEASLKDEQQELIKNFLTRIKISDSDSIEYLGLASQLYRSLIQDLKERKVEGSFVKNMNFIVHQAITYSQADCNWLEVLSWIRFIILKNIQNSMLLRIAQDIFYVAAILVGNVINGKEMLNGFNINRMYINSRSVVQELGLAIYRDQLNRAIEIIMNRFNIKQYYVCLYTNPIENLYGRPFNFPIYTHIEFGYVNGRTIHNEIFETKDMLPDSYIHQEQRNDLIFYPLYSDREHFGYIVFNLTTSDVKIYETLREQISNTLKRQMLSDQRRVAEEQLNFAVAELEKYNNKLHQQSIHDELTGIYNRRGFYTEAENYHEFALQTKKRFYVIFGDMDGLKSINDKFGHTEGDYAIQMTSKLLKDCFSSDDILARMGGDEFTILSIHIQNEDEIKEMIEKIKRTFADFSETIQKEYKLSISLGYTAFDPFAAEPLETLLKRADDKLYIEKKESRHRL